LLEFGYSCKIYLSFHSRTDQPQDEFAIMFNLIMEKL